MKRIFFSTLLIVFSSTVILSSCNNSDSPGPDPVLYNVKTFDLKRHAFGGGFEQSYIETFEFPGDPTKVEKISMFIKLRCPGGGCNAWDMFANVKVMDTETQAWYEIGRYITPYGVDNSALARGFEVDVTDFKSLLTGEVTLRSFIEVWGADGWLVSIDFDIIEGTPDYPYYAIVPVLDYANHSLSGVPYGEEHNLSMLRTISIPANAEETSFRTTITGWGHATPADPGGRRCAEWCFRTHDVLIENQLTFQHEMGPIGCGSNPVQPQYGNWAPDRAGWCPGMEVPVRTDLLPNPMNGNSFTYEYRFEEWINDFQTVADNPHAYYAISSFVVVKSQQPIEKPVVN